MNVIERMDMFAESEPRICIWCKYCGVVVLGHHWGNVCIKSADGIGKRVKNAILPFPVNCEKRTRVQCVNSDEMHPECFVPTRLTCERIKLMEALGLLPEENDGR